MLMGPELFVNMIGIVTHVLIYRTLDDCLNSLV